MNWWHSLLLLSERERIAKGAPIRQKFLKVQATLKEGTSYGGSGL